MTYAAVMSSALPPSKNAASKLRSNAASPLNVTKKTSNYAVPGVSKIPFAGRVRRALVSRPIESGVVDQTAQTFLRPDRPLRVASAGVTLDSNGDVVGILRVK